MTEDPSSSLVLEYSSCLSWTAHLAIIFQMNLPTNVPEAIQKPNTEFQTANIEGIVVVVSGQASPAQNMWHTALFRKCWC